MAASLITKVFPEVMGAATNVQQLGSMWYKASNEFDEFQTELGRLRRLHDLWFVESQAPELLEDQALKGTLEDAARLLEQTASSLKMEEHRLKSKEEAKGTFGLACLMGCWPMVCLLVFPTEVRARMQLVIDTFEKIPVFLKSEEDIKNALHKRKLEKAYSLALPFSHDDRYVSFEESESAVHSALMKPKAVVLLHGGPGRGKTSLARHVALYYNDQRRNAQEGTAGPLFEQVIFVECGPDVEILPKQLELLGLLQSDTIAIQEGEQMTPKKTTDSEKIPSLLKGMLKSRKILLIFDDVWSDTFLQNMIDLCGLAVKCLVTSQRGDLCRGVNPGPNCSATEIAIQDIAITHAGRQDIADTVAGKLLASHVGFRNKRIPDGRIKEEIEKIIQVTDGNSLALASIAATVPRGRAYYVKAWKNVSKSFFQLLKEEATTAIQSKKYPRSFWSAMQFSFRSLTKEAQRVLLLIHLCVATSVPEEVVEYLHRNIIIEDDGLSFQRGRSELESRELLKITIATSDDKDETEYLWSTHSLQRRFVEEHLLGDKEELLQSLIQLPNVVSSEVSMEIENVTTSLGCEETKIRLVLCALYFDEKFGDKAASKIGISYDKFTTVKRNAMQPIIRLFVQMDWETQSEGRTLKTSMMEVILVYICDGTLHHEGITHLLSTPVCITPLLDTLENMAYADSTIFMGIPSGGWLEKLINLLSQYHDPHLQKRALLTLFRLSRNNSQLILKMLDYPRTLDYLSNLVSKDIDPNLQAETCRILANMISDLNWDSKPRIITFHGLLEKLIILLSNSSSLSMNYHIMFCFAWSAELSSNHSKLEPSTKILGSPMALQLFGNLLREHPEVQQEAERTLHALVAAPGRMGIVNSMKIIEFPDILNNLTKMMSNDINSPNLRNWAVAIFAKMAQAGLEETKYIDRDEEPAVKMKLEEGMKTKLDGVEDLEEALLGLLAEGVNPRTQYDAAFAMTVISPARGNAADVFSGDAYNGRARANRYLGLDKESLADYDKADELKPEDMHTLWGRTMVRGRLGDYQGALDDVNRALKIWADTVPGEDDNGRIFHARRKSDMLSERGVVKRMMNDLHGALADFNEALELRALARFNEYLESGEDDYESLKHRGYVRYLMQDEEGARSDAELAMKVKIPDLVDYPLYPQRSLDMTSVEYLDYKLR